MVLIGERGFDVFLASESAPVADATASASRAYAGPQRGARGHLTL
jgi:hypothetical protein